MIADRTDLTTAKQLLDNYDQTGAVIAALVPGAIPAISIAGKTNPTFVVISATEALLFLQTMQANLAVALKKLGVTI